MKLHYLRSRHGLRVGTLATATPIANSITEAHVMQRYLRPDLLDAAGVRNFDSWAATFGQSTTDVELSPDGGSFRLKQRFARFHNVPELLRMWWVSGDVKTAEDLKLPRPELLARPEDGRREPQTFVIPPSPQLQDFITDLAARAERVQRRAVEPNEDNMLLISSHGRAAALDMRLVGQHAPPGESKIDVAADNIATIWKQNRDNVYLQKSGAEQPAPGALQLVFCDQSTPNTERWNVYDALRELLVQRGLPAQQIRFIHEARNDREKGELFEACRTGKVSVLLGSTAKMGVGTNVQDRVIALHHLDCPWRPADLAQRDGRALRRGNQNSEIGLYRYVVEGSFDAYSWQTVGRKATFIAQIMRGRLDQREIEDIGDSALSYNEVKALAAGNPLLLDKAKADADLARLERLERSHIQSRGRLRYSIEHNERAIGRTERDIAALEAAIARRRDTRGDKFAMTVDGRTYDSRPDAGQAVMNRLLLTLDRPGANTTIHGIAALGGLTFDATILRSELGKGYELSIAGVPRARTGGSHRELQEAKPASLAVRMENRLNDLDRVLHDEQASLVDASTEIVRAADQLEQPFPQAESLTLARRRLSEIEAQLSQLAAVEAADDEPSNEPPTENTSAPATGAPRIGGPAGQDDGRGESHHPATTAAAALTPPPPRSREGEGARQGCSPPGPREEPSLHLRSQPVTPATPRPGR